MAQARRTLLDEVCKNRAFRSLLLALLTRRLLRPRRAPNIHMECYPGRPCHKEIVWKVALLAGIGLCVPSRSAPPARSDPLRLFWGGRTSIDPSTRKWPAPEWSGALNAGIGDTGKRNVGRVFARTFGYGLTVDPTRHVGPCVVKSDANATHDGQVMQCPIAAADPDRVYERLVDNRTAGNEVLDLRVTVVGAELPFVYLKYRPIEHRFANGNSSVAVGMVDEFLSPAEQRDILLFCRTIGLDMGEIDVLRDNATGRIYIVDVNSMPFGPPKPISLKDGLHAITLYTDSFVRLAEGWSAAGTRRAVVS